ncbi:MAG: DUF1501 domain-containing protein [Rhodobacteraceae bacterium]|nr:DUF1501 domain-containing protein [Paracoccaceae bacterium]
MTNELSRRRFLATMGATLPAITLPGFVTAAGATPDSAKTLILIELAGGNDGLNTVVPLTDAAYHGLRPTIGITEGLNLDRDTALHPAMRGMAGLWEAGDMQIVEGVGYPDPNRSHFRSIEIWNVGRGAQTKDRTGWISHAFEKGAPTGTDADGLVLGGQSGPLRGQGRFSVIEDEETFLETLRSLESMPHAIRPQTTSALDHVLGAYEAAEITGGAIAARLERGAARSFDFPETLLGEQLHSVARLMDAGAEVPVYKVQLHGFDTHDNQPDAHTFLLEELSDAVAAFAKAAREMGRWNDVAVVTYSEFGRTARENGSAGTDHGTAAPVFVSGGAVAGGFGGARVDLTRLKDDDLVHTTDYRALYDGLLGGLWNIDASTFQGHGRLKLFA